MRSRHGRWRVVLLSAVAVLALMWKQPAAAVDSEISAGTRFMVELRDKIDAKKTKRGKKFEARTLEPLQSADGRFIRVGAKLKGQVSYAEDNQLILRFDRIESGSYNLPIFASVTRVVDERGVHSKPGDEGEIKADGARGKDAAIGAGVGGGIGAAAGAIVSGGGGKETAMGAGAGAVLGALIGAASGGKDLVLPAGTRLEVQLDRPLYLPYRASYY
ncbi:MAG: hypothetical protein HYX73_07965 [Acidobacteria bacterium]|nr:hypothetical protein [Acidobacteriota bacterium]